jgi:hypothetical protein
MGYQDVMARSIQSDAGLCLVNQDLELCVRTLVARRRRSLTLGEKAYLALKSIGRPAHAGEIAEKLNAMFPDHPLSRRHTHAVLGHEEHGIVWVGARSTFALSEWGYEHPAEGLFDGVASIVRDVYRRVGQPVPFTTVVAEMGKRRRIAKPSSLMFAAHLNRELKRVGDNLFIPVDAYEIGEQEKDLTDENVDSALKEFELRMRRQRIPQP